MRITRGKPMKFSKSILLATIATLSLHVAAEEQSPIIVTATRTAQTVDNTLASVSVITHEDIQRMQANSLVDVLQQTLGIDFVENGSYGKNSQIYMRGTNTDHVLVLIDGAKAGSMTTGEVRYSGIPLSQIDRIEIVRGPRSSIYGTDAIGGVIQIFTKKGSNATKRNFKLGAGSENTYVFNMGQSGGNDTTNYSVQIERIDTQGINVREDKNTDDDGYSNNAISANLQHKFTKNTVLDVNVMHAKGITEYDGSPYTSDFYDDFLQQSLNTSLNHAVTKDWTTKLTANQFSDKRQIFENNMAENYYNTQRQELSWQNDITLSEAQLLTLGINQQKDNLTTNVSYGAKIRKNDSVFTQYQWFGESQNLALGLRSDKYTEYGQQNSGNIAWGIKLTKKLRLHTAYATSFKAPTFNQQYNSTSGNLNIKPETSKNIEAGISGKVDHGEWQFNAFQTDITNLISYVNPKFENVDEARIKGLEASVKTIIAGWQTQANVSWLSPKDAKTGKLLRRRSEQHFSLSLDRIINQWGIGASIIAKSERYDGTNETNRLPGYTLLNLRSSYKINKKWSVNAKIDNVLEEEYQTLRNYSLADRTFLISVSYSE